MFTTPYSEQAAFKARQGVCGGRRAGFEKTTKGKDARRGRREDAESGMNICLCLCVSACADAAKVCFLYLSRVVVAGGV